MVVLVSNQFLLVSKHAQKSKGPEQSPPILKWRSALKKLFDFNQINGDFINLIQLKNYQRENKSQNFCSSIFLSLHQGCQVVIWEATNYPKIKMKFIWFYVVSDQLQPFCAAEIPYIDLTTQSS